jgi:uncharacterized protein (TIGR02246 family)
MRCLVVAFALGVCGSLSVAEWSGAAEPSHEEAVVSAIDGLAAAFNAQDAAAVASHWATEGVHVNQETGARTEGRAAIQAMYASVFEAGTAPRLRVHIHRVQFVTKDVALVDGQATVVSDLGPEPSSFSAVVVKEGQEWLLHSSRETALPVALRPADHLSALEWLIGDWVDAESEGAVRSSVRWSAKNAFLIRSFRAQINDEVAYEGTQVFGWDPTNERIRVWMFGSEGGFGEGYVDASGDRIAIHLKGTLADGRVASATQVLTRTDADSFTSQLVAHEVDGQPQPTPDAVLVVRAEDEMPPHKTEAPAKKPAPLKPQPEKVKAVKQPAKPAEPAQPKSETPAKTKPAKSEDNQPSKKPAKNEKPAKPESEN